MIKSREIDKLLILTTLLLFATGIVMTWSTTYIMAMERFGSGYFFVKRHLLFGFLALATFIIAMRIDYKVYQKLAYPILAISAVMLMLIFIPGIGHMVGGARRWIKAGGFTFQPSEFAKLAVIIYLAYSLSKKHGKVKRFWIGFLPHIIITGIIMLLILKEPDFGTAMVLGLIIFLMMFIAGVRIGHLMLLFVFALPFAYTMITKAKYRMDRIYAFIDPWKDPSGAGFQIVQSFLAFGTGGIWGIGLGEGRRKLFYLPEAHTDFIFSIVGEELGLVGVIGVILLYIIFLISGIRISLNAPDLFGTYLAFGLTLFIALPAVVNMGVVMGLLPTKGLTLPFISYGGTSLLISMIGVGILLNIYIKGQEAL